MVNNKEYDKLEKLIKIFGPCGLEEEVQHYFAKIMKSIGYKIRRDGARNYYAEIKGDSKLPKIMITAHADSIGFMVGHINEKGLIFTRDVGPWGTNNVDYRSLPGKDAIIEGRKIEGRKDEERIFGHFDVNKPIHLISDEEMETSIAREDLVLDINSESLKQSKRYVSVGDYVALDPNYKPDELNSNESLTATSIDNRMGEFCMYRIGKEIRKLKKKCPISFVSTVSEEAGLGSARLAAENVRPDIALVLDTTAATDQIVEDSEETIARRYGDISLYKLVISRGPTFDNDLFKYIEKTCIGRGKKIKIPYQIEPDCRGTDSEHIKVAGVGVETAAILMPVRNAHTRVETVSLRVAESAIELCVDLCKSVSTGRYKPKSFYNCF